jgi:DNA-binding NtrC family response regulator
MAMIFVVDDAPLLLNLVSTMLRSDGHEVRSASDAEAAIKAIRASQPPV